MQRLATIAFAFLLSSCAIQKKEVIISKNMNVCAKAKSQFNYDIRGRGVDYEYGKIFDGRHELDIYIGYQPNFPVDKFVKLQKYDAEGRFYRAGINGQSRLLQATGRTKSTFIMITGIMGKKAEEILYSDDFFYLCKNDQDL